MLRSCYFQLFLLAIPVVFFFACSNKPATTEKPLGEIDSAKLAADTSTEVDLDLSYEFQKSLVQNDSTVYDFLAYDKPQTNGSKAWEGKLLVIKRTNNGQDTIIRDQRKGPVEGLSLASIDGDALPSIVFYEFHDKGRYQWQLHIYRPGQDGRFDAFQYKDQDVTSSPGRYHGSDTFFIYQGHIIRRYRYCSRDSACWQSYKMSNGRLMLENERIVP